MENAFEKAVDLALAEAAKHDNQATSVEGEFFLRGYIKGVAAALGIDRNLLLCELEKRWRTSLGLQEQDIAP